MSATNGTGGSSRRLENKIAIVTGGARGIGAAIAGAYVAEGASVVVTDVLDELGEQLAADLGDRTTYRHLDVRDEGQWAEVVQACSATFGPVNVLVNNAGINAAKSIKELTRDDFIRVFDINVAGAFLGIKSVADVMTQHHGGSIIIMSSAASAAGLDNHSCYAASKAGNAALARCAAVELGHQGIRVNSIHPGGVDTDMSRNPDFDSIDKNAWYQRLPIQRIGEPEDVALAAVFLASDESSYITGSQMMVDGGQIAGTKVF